MGLPESGSDLSPAGLAILVEKGVLGDSTDSCLAQLSRGFPGGQQSKPSRPGALPKGIARTPSTSPGTPLTGLSRDGKK